MRNILGIIVEYNPFHNGHKYHLEAERGEKDIIIAVMSGDFVQRGEPAIIDKRKRTEIALENGVDIVVELPIFYSTQSAEIFALGAVKTLEYLDIDKLVFGSERFNEKELLDRLKIENDDKFKKIIKKYIGGGNSYPTSYGKALKDLGIEDQLMSNEILGLEYLKALKKIDSKIVPKSIERKNVGYYSTNIIKNISSASGIRRRIVNGEDIDDLVVENGKSILMEAIKNNKLGYLKDFYPYIRYKIISDMDKLENIQDIEEGYWKKLYDEAIKYENFEEFFQKIQSKRYTQGRIQRILIHILLGITKEITNKTKERLPYIKVLGFSESGREYLKSLKKAGKKILTSNKNIKKILDDDERYLFELNERGSLIYSMVNYYERKGDPIIKSERDKITK